jgi:hypothetical protein
MDLRKEGLLESPGGSEVCGVCQMHTRSCALGGKAAKDKGGKTGWSLDSQSCSTLNTSREALKSTQSHNKGRESVSLLLGDSC